MARSSATEVEVARVHHDGVWARTSTVGHDGTRAFLLVPGIGVSSNYFERLAFHLNEFGPVVALDLPGFGGVPHPRGGRRMTIGDYAELVDRVIEERGLDDPVVIGHSMGTQVVAALAARRRLSDVVLISPVVNRHERTVPRAGLRFLQSSLHEPPRVAAMALYAYLLCGVRWFSRVLPSMMRFPIEDVLPGVSARALVIAGQRDALCPPAWVAEVVDLLPDATSRRIPDAAHSVMHANAEEVARLCVAHARRTPPEEVRAPEPAGRVDHPEPSAGDTVRAAAGGLTELRGILADDDALVARGKTMAAEAGEDAARRAADD